MSYDENKQISELDEVTTPADDDKLPIYDTSELETGFIQRSNLLTSVTNPTSDQDVATKAYVDQHTVVTVGTTAGADYVCDGTADEVQINAAIASLSATGGVVLLQPGTYSLADRILNENDNITVVGSGQDATTLELANNTTLTAGASLYNIVYNSGDNFVISDLTIDGNKANQSQAQNGILLKSCSNCKISSVKIIDIYYRAIYLSVAVYNHIINNYISACGDRAIELESGSSSNKITQNNIISPVSHGIQVDVASLSNIIDGNYINNAGNFSIGVDSLSHLTIISNNIIVNSFDEGVQITNSMYCRVVNNHIDIVENDFGISVESRTTNNCNFVQIIGNFVAGTQISAIALLGTYYGMCCNNHIFRANTSATAATGAIMTNDTTRYNTISNNIIIDDRGTIEHDWGIQEQTNGDYNIITGNQVIGYATAGVATVGANTVTADNISKATT